MMGYIYATPDNVRWSPFSLISVGLGLVSIYAGVALWLGAAGGLWASRIMQALQVVRIYTGPLLYVLLLGPQLLINLFVGPGLSITTHPPAPLPLSAVVDFSAAFGLLAGGMWGSAPPGIGINVFAAIAFGALLKARPVVRTSPAENAVPLPPR
jgi:hypothetical protein